MHCSQSSLFPRTASQLKVASSGAAQTFNGDSPRARGLELQRPWSSLVWEKYVKSMTRAYGLPFLPSSLTKADLRRGPSERTLEDQLGSEGQA